MLIRTRLIILAGCIVLFAVLAPYLVLYSIGYRIDFTDLKITKTGGIYVKALPLGASVTIDSTAPETTNIFSNTVFVQDLLPRLHSIVIKKSGYDDYQKNLPVAGNQVTKLEHVILFKTNPHFGTLSKNINWFSLSPDGTMALASVISAANQGNMQMELINTASGQATDFSLPTRGPVSNALWSSDSTEAIITANNSFFLVESLRAQPKVTLLPLGNAQGISLGTSPATENPENTSTGIFFIKNKNLYVQNQNIPVLKNVLAYSINGSRITWLSYDGFLYVFDTTIAVEQKISAVAFPIKQSSSYVLLQNSGNILLQEDGSLFIFNTATKAFNLLAQNSTQFKFSPNGSQIIYASGNKLWYVDLSAPAQKPALLETASKPIAAIWWINDYYVGLQSSNSLSISETDERGHINTVTLPATISLPAGNLHIENPLVFFNQKDQKLYILTQQTLVSSERLTP